ncbi:MAG: putative nicotinamide N-methyase [Bradymonadia bacterium]|jgi:predicted nicotinamide N-methyase
MPAVQYEHHSLRLGNFEIHLRTLLDRNQLEDGEAEFVDGVSAASWSLSGVVWPSGMALAQLMLDYDIEGKRILEIGCGIALPSLVLGQRSADITATDNNAAAGRFLLDNTERNGARAIPFECAEWNQSGRETGLGRFDVIIASDVLYEPDHAADLCDFLEAHATPTAEFLMVDPRRGNVGKFTKRMVGRGYDTDELSAPLDPATGDAHRVRIVRYRRV